MVAGSGIDADFGCRRCLVDVPVLAAVPGKHVGRHPHQPTFRRRAHATRSTRKLDPAVKAAMRACEARMDGDISGQAPWTSELLVLAMALAGLAWLTLVVALRWQLRTKAVAAVPGLATVGCGAGRSCDDRR